ncbi:hypothetical protein [Pseudonocardia sp. N23]|uniref:hypothetical protein n=1 Tax=Pseudonocardia sp. N23 TaxID=1987376 RepID=UPI000BFC8C53|nr:hypothetical protein [Pseudonocardia sp. N23]GAY12056.1 hypothetical protein TOK_0446 [Pseudonocardia sp. N23]
MPDPCRGCDDPRCPRCATARIPAVEPHTEPIQQHPWLPGHWEPAPPATNGYDHQLNQAIDDGGQTLRIVAATCSLAVLVSTGGLYVTGNLLWLLGIMPGAVVAAVVVVGIVALLRRSR